MPPSLKRKVSHFLKTILKYLRPYIRATRLIIWFLTRPHVRGVNVAIICENEVLLVENTYRYGYGLPGGGIEPEEKEEAAAKREVLEEVGIQLGHVSPLGSFISYEDYKQDTVYGFYAEVSSKEFVLDFLEIEKAQWYNLHSLPEMEIVPQKIIQAYKDIQR